MNTRRALLACLFFTLTAAAVFALIMRRNEIIDVNIADFDGDGALEVIILERITKPRRVSRQFDEVYHVKEFGPLPKEAHSAAKDLVFGNVLTVYRLNDTDIITGDLTHSAELNKHIENGRLEQVYTADFTELRPLMLRAGDIDGDRINEISICVFKTTEFHPIYAKRPFIYRFAGDCLSPVWRGSRLSKPFEDYIFFDFTQNGIDELISIEIRSDGEKELCCYKWGNFGFELAARSPAYKHISNLQKEAGGIITVNLEEQGNSRKLRFQYKKNESDDRFYDEGFIVEVK